MAYNEELAKRIRLAIDIYYAKISESFIEKKMFGGLAFLYKGKMTVGVIKNDLTVRVVSQKMDNVLEMQHVRPMDFTKKPMKEFIFVSQEGIKTEIQLQNWLELGLEHAKSKTEKFK